MNCCKVRVHVGVECVDVCVRCVESSVIGIKNMLGESEAIMKVIYIGQE